MKGDVVMKTFVFLILVAFLLLVGCAQVSDKLSGLSGGAGKVKSLVVEKASTVFSNDAFLHVVFFDVGQGLSVFIRTPGGKTVLFDCGEEKADVVDKLKAEGVSSLDWLVVSHPHDDHLGGCDEVIHTFPVGIVWDNGMSYSSIQYKEYADSLVGEDHRKVLTDENVYLDSNIKTRFIVPYDTPQGENTEVNSNSVLLRLDFGENSFLLTGDCDDDCEDDILDDGVNVDVLQVGHHGSKTATSERFLDVVTPDVVVISVGEENSYGHPANETLDRLKDFIVFRTDLNGTMRLKSDGSTISLER